MPANENAMFNQILTSKHGKAGLITINRAEKLNALNKEVLEELEKAVQLFLNDKEIAGIVITGAGNKAFAAGADIAAFSDKSVEEGMDLAKKGQDIFFSIEQADKPIIAAVNGFALGGGCELAMACHFRYAAEQAKFGQPEVNLGLIPGYGGTQRLVQLIGKGRAIEMLVTGKIIDGNTAVQYGLANLVCPQDQLLEQCFNTIELIATKAPLAVSACIEAANLAFESAQIGFKREIELFGACFGTADMKEGTAAFLEKRKATFTGK